MGKKSMKFEVAKIYTHIRMRDVAVFVLKVGPSRKDYKKIRIRWLTRTGLDIGKTEVLTIIKKEYKNWIPFSIK